MTDHRAQQSVEDPGLSWSQLRAFEACARLASFSVAAVALNISPSAVRFQVGLLEGRLGAVLFERQDGRLALTPIGQNFARQIARPYRDLLAACASATQGAADAPLTLSAPPLFTRQFLLGPAFLAWCQANRVRLDVADDKRDLFGPALIAAIRLNPEPMADVRATPLLGVTLCLAATPAAAVAARPRDAAWWAQQTLLCPSAGEKGWAEAWAALSIDPPPAAPRIPYASYAAAMEAACAGHGVILAPLPFAQEEFAHGRLAPVSDIRISSSAGYALVMRESLAVSARARALARRVVQLCAGPGPGKKAVLF